MSNCCIVVGCLGHELLDDRPGAGPGHDRHGAAGESDRFGRGHGAGAASAHHAAHVSAIVGQGQDAGRGPGQIEIASPGGDEAIGVAGRRQGRHFLLTPYDLHRPKRAAAAAGDDGHAADAAWQEGSQGRQAGRHRSNAGDCPMAAGRRQPGKAAAGRGDVAG